MKTRKISTRFLFSVSYICVCAGCHAHTHTRVSRPRWNKQRDYFKGQHSTTYLIKPKITKPPSCSSLAQSPGYQEVSFSFLSSRALWATRRRTDGPQRHLDIGGPRAPSGRSPLSIRHLISYTPILLSKNKKKKVACRWKGLYSRTRLLQVCKPTLPVC